MVTCGSGMVIGENRLVLDSRPARAGAPGFPGRSGGVSVGSGPPRAMARPEGGFHAFLDAAGDFPRRRGCRCRNCGNEKPPPMLVNGGPGLAGRARP